jgi:hypothetical protein
VSTLARDEIVRGKVLKIVGTTKLTFLKRVLKSAIRSHLDAPDLSLHNKVQRKGYVGAF